MPNHQLHPDGVLQNMTGHILYEVGMLDWCWQAHDPLKAECQKRPQLQAQLNVVVEGFLIHFRQLRDFFMADAPNPKDNDVFAWEFSRSGIRRPYGGGFQLKSAEVREVSVRVAHITTERRKSRDHNAKEMRSALRDAYVEWMHELAPRWKEDPNLQDAGKIWTFPPQPMINQGRIMTSSSPMSFGSVSFDPTER